MFDFVKLPETLPVCSVKLVRILSAAMAFCPAIATLIVFLLLFNVAIVCAQTSTLWAIAAAEGNKTSLPASFIVNVAVVELVRIVVYLPPMAAPFRAPPEVVKYCFTFSSFIYS